MVGVKPREFEKGMEISISEITREEFNRSSVHGRERVVLGLVYGETALQGETSGQGVIETMNFLLVFIMEETYVHTIPSHK